MTTDVFNPIGDTLLLAASSASSRVALADPKIGFTEREYMLFNAGSVDAFVAFGGSGITAAIPADGVPANGFPVPAGYYAPIRQPASVSYLAAITASGTTEIYITVGRGF